MELNELSRSELLSIGLSDEQVGDVLRAQLGYRHTSPGRRKWERGPRTRGVFVSQHYPVTICITRGEVVRNYHPSLASWLRFNHLFDVPPVVGCAKWPAT